MGKGSGTAGRSEKKSTGVKPQGSAKIDGWLDKKDMYYLEYLNSGDFWYEYDESGVKEQKGITEARMRSIDKQIEERYKGLKMPSYEEYEKPIAPATPLTKNQADALYWYQMKGASQINEELRSGKISRTNADDIKHIDSAFKPLDKDIIVYRGASRFSKKDKAFLSTTSNPDVAARFAREVEGRKGKIMAMLIPKGTPVIVAPRTGNNENEILLPRNFNTSSVKTKIVYDLKFKNNIHGWK